MVIDEKLAVVEIYTIYKTIIYTLTVAQQIKVPVSRTKTSN